MCYEGLPFCPVSGAREVCMKAWIVSGNSVGYVVPLIMPSFFKNSKNCISLQCVSRAKKC